MKRSRSMIIFFLAPAILAYIVVFLYPTIQTIIFSFFHVSSFGGAEISFAGLENYTRTIRTPQFLISVKNIVLVWLAGGAAIFFLAFVFTTLLTSGVRGKNFFRAVIYMPNIVSSVAIAALWTQYIFQPRYGLFKSFFAAIGLETLSKFQWTASEHIFWAMLVAYIWGGVGWFLLLILAGAERIPADYFEAARLDGANMIQSFLLITLPLLRDVIRVAVVMWSITVINLFAFPRNFTPVSQPNETFTPAIFLYNKAFGGGTGTQPIQIGQAAAVGVLLLIMVMVASAIINRLIRAEKLEY
jgi:ABC-type sugar transport system permease subunit